MKQRVRAIACAVAAFLCVPFAHAATAQHADPETYRRLLARLQPGDQVLLAPGDYLRGLPLSGLAGEPGREIVIAAADPMNPPRFLARAGANTASLVNVRHIVLRDLVFDGKNLPVDAIKAEGHSRYADFVTLENLVIRDHAASQQNVGISTKCPAYGWVVRGNRIERVGTGMYFGDADGSDPFVGGVIERNHVSATLGYNVQIKHQKSAHPDHPGTHDTVLRDNVFSKAGSQASSQPRPNVLLGHPPTAGAGSENRILVVGNVFRDNPTEALLQAEGRVAIYDNVFVNRHGDAIHIQPHKDIPRDVWVFSNTVLASGVGIRVLLPPEPRFVQRVIGNLVAAAEPWRGGAAEFNAGLGYQIDLLELAPAALGAALRARVRQLPHLRPALQDELAAFPGWQPRPGPGAQLPRRRRFSGSLRPRPVARRARADTGAGRTTRWARSVVGWAQRAHAVLATPSARQCEGNAQ